MTSAKKVTTAYWRMNRESHCSIWNDFADDISFDINEGSDLRSPSRKKRDFVSSLEE